MAKKKRRKAPEGVDPNEKRRERLEARRAAKAAELERQRKAEQRTRLIRMAVYVGLFALAVWFFFFRGSNLPEEVAGHAVQVLDADGEGVHQEPPITYEESPPVAGPHTQGVLPCGTYSEPATIESVVHSLEHGAVYALYSPDLEVEQIRTLEGLIAQEGWDENFLVSPYEGEMPEGTVVSIGSWGHRMDLSEVDAAAIVEYKETFEGTETAEADLGCPIEQDQTFEPEEEATPGANATAAPTSTPGANATLAPTPTPEAS
jgi:Protein of unknown function (DUF3105)